MECKGLKRSRVAVLAPGREGLRHLRAATGLARPLPLFSPTPPLPPLCTLYTPFKCQSGSIWAQPCSGSLTTARGPRPRQWHWETRAGGERASLQSAAESPGAGRAWGPCGAQAAASSQEPIPTWHRARWRLSPQLQRGAQSGGGFGVPCPAPSPGLGLGGPLGAGGEDGRRARG